MHLCNTHTHTHTHTYTHTHTHTHTHTQTHTHTRTRTHKCYWNILGVKLDIRHTNLLRTLSVTENVQIERRKQFAMDNDWPNKLFPLLSELSLPNVALGWRFWQSSPISCQMPKKRAHHLLRYSVSVGVFLLLLFFFFLGGLTRHQNAKYLSWSALFWQFYLLIINSSQNVKETRFHIYNEDVNKAKTASFKQPGWPHQGCAGGMEQSGSAKVLTGWSAACQRSVGGWFRQGEVTSITDSS